MRKIVIIILVIFIVLVISFLGIGFFSGVFEFDFTPNRKGDIIQTSYDLNELLNKNSRFSFLSGNIKDIEWYCQISEITGDKLLKIPDYCYNGNIVLKDDYYQDITTKYEWKEYDYMKLKESLVPSDFALRAMYATSMIRESLKSKQLYVCDDRVFFDGGSYFTFLDKESKTLYFYCWAM